jgi:hypothetical protein
VPVRDAGGALILQSSQLDYVVASFWVSFDIPVSIATPWQQQ